MNIILSIGKKSIRNLFAAVIITAAISCAFTGCSKKKPQTPDVSILDNQYIVLWEQDVTPESRQTLISSLQTFSVVSVFDEVYSIVKNDRLPVTDALEALRTLPGVIAADPDYILTTESFSDDTFADSQWPLENPGSYRYHFTTEVADPILLPSRDDVDINFPEARDLYRELITSPREVVVAVIDTGIDINHPELRDNIWTNLGEIPDDGIDNDGNGYVDDIHGWDFYNSDNTVIHLDRDASDAYIDNDTHGTQVAGIIAATSENGMGISGAASFVPIKLMPLKINGGPNGLGSVSSAIKAINYATEAGADVCNMSWGSASISSTLKTLEAAMKASDMLFVCAAGNSGTDNDVNPIYPASIRLPNNISVTFVNELGHLVEQTVSADGTLYGSNYGANTVDIAAPGTYILTTSPGGSYSAPSGSSMAAPYVSAIAAMLMSTQENLYPAEIRELILSSAKRVPSDMITPTPTVSPTPEGLEPTPASEGDITGTPSVTPSENITGTPTATPEATSAPAPPQDPAVITATPVPTPVPTVTVEPSPTPVPSVTPEPVTSTPVDEPAPSGTPELIGPDEPTPLPTQPEDPLNPFHSLIGKVQTPGIPNMYNALLQASSLLQDTDIPSVEITRTFDKSMILIDVQGADILSGPRVLRYEKETGSSSHTVEFFRRGIGGTAFTGPLKLARPGIYSFYVSDYAGNESVIRYEVPDDLTAPEIVLFTTLKSPSGVAMAVLDVSDYESGLSTFQMLPGQHKNSDFTAAGAKPTTLKPVDGRLLLRFEGNTIYTLCATDHRGNSMTYEIKLVS